MDVTQFNQPAPGTTQPGDLYVDLESRSLWLGVDSAVDETGSVLISDIEAMLAHDAQMLADAKTYTDAQILTRAPTSHTHTAAQITNFTPAVQGVVNAMPGLSFVRGMVMMYSGPLTDIGVNELTGWALCDGRVAASLPGGKTPNLKDHFIIGAGNLLPGDNNDLVIANPDTADAGSHTHTVGGTSLTTGMLPVHAHGVGTYKVVDNTDPAGAHGHPTRLSVASQGSSGQDTTGGFQLLNNALSNLPAHTSTTPGSGAGDQIGMSPTHTHPINSVVSGTSANAGNNETHTHTLSGEAAHKHAIDRAAIRNAIAWYTLAYIIKL